MDNSLLSKHLKYESIPDHQTTIVGRSNSITFRISYKRDGKPACGVLLKFCKNHTGISLLDLSGITDERGEVECRYSITEPFIDGNISAKICNFFGSNLRSTKLKLVK